MLFSFDALSDSDEGVEPDMIFSGALKVDQQCRPRLQVEEPGGRVSGVTRVGFTRCGNC